MSDVERPKTSRGTRTHVWESIENRLHNDSINTSFETEDCYSSKSVKENYSLEVSESNPGDTSACDDSCESESESESTESEVSFSSIIDVLEAMPYCEVDNDHRKRLMYKETNVPCVNTAADDEVEDTLEVIVTGESEETLEEGNGESESKLRKIVGRNSWMICKDDEREREEEDPQHTEELQLGKLQREEEVGGPGGVSVAASRPGTQESGQVTPRQLVWLQAGGEGGEGGGSDVIGGRRSPDLMKINTHAANFRTSHEEVLDTHRSPLFNGHKIANGSVTAGKAHTNGYIPNGVAKGATNGHTFVNGSSVFDTDADVDIATMAAQRDQRRGARYNRGMMAPVMSKEEDSRSRSANRRMLMTKQRSESMLDQHDEVAESQEDDSLYFGNGHGDNRETNDIMGTRHGRRGVREINNQMGGILGSISGIGLRPTGDYLDIDHRGDIMAQSMRRQSLRGSKQSLNDGLHGNFESNNSSRISLGNMTPDDHMALRHDEDDLGNDQGIASERKGRNLPRFIPNSREDIQILNLQGFMDMTFIDGGSTGRRKHKKKRLKRSIETGHMDSRETYKLGGSKPRRKKTHRLSKSHLSDDDGEMMLKDIDDLDSKVAGLVLGPKSIGKESTGRPITLEEASALRNLLTGNPSQSLPIEWMTQNFTQNTNSNLSYGLVQKKGGPCGVLACVQAYIMKCLIFGTPLSPNTSPVSPLRPSQREWQWALAAAITEILWKAGSRQKTVIAMPGAFVHFTEHGVGRYSRDGVTETLMLHEFVDQNALHENVIRHLKTFTSETSSGCVILLYSLLLTRGLENIQNDMDSGGGHLINAHGYSSQEIVSLFLTGVAATNTFNGNKMLGDNASQSVTLRGVHQKCEIGFLSLFEHYNCYKVGSFLKTPQYPVWVVCCESHFSCLFSRDPVVTSDTPPNTSVFDLYYYDGLALQEDEIRLTLDLDAEESDLAIVPPLENCIRTKWKKVAINWNGTEPIL